MGIGKVIWLTSDLHINHTNILKYCNRPFQNTYEMNEAIITNWNSCIKPGEIVYCLGDFAFGDTRNIDKIFNRLNGKKHLIIGNHDGKHTLNLPWESKSNLLEITVDRQLVVLCHYAMRTWNQSHRGSYHLFGHTHSRLQPYGLSFDVGVDAWNYTPVSWDQIKAKMATLTKPNFVDSRDFEDYSI
jgi:calcineurin-like phosphoesterase family protein